MVYKAHLRRREEKINDEVYIGHLNALKFAQANNGSDEFSTPFNKIKLIQGEVDDLVDMANDLKMKKEVVRREILKG